MENKIENNYTTRNNLSNQNVYNENNIDNKDYSISENKSENSNTNENNTSNCLALTIRKDYKLTSVTNVVLRSLRMTFKVFVSYVTMNIIKLFF